MKKLRILTISEHFYPIRGGSVTYVQNLTRELGRRSDVFLVTYSPASDLPSNQWFNSDHTQVLNLRISSSHGYNTRIGRRAFTSRLMRTLPKILYYIKPDLVHILYGHEVPRVLRYVPSAIPRLWTIHNVPPREYGSFSFPAQRLGPVLKRPYDLVAGIIHRTRIRKYLYSHLVASSMRTRAELMGLGIQGDRITKLNIGIDTKIFKPLVNGARQSIRQRLKIVGKPMILCVAAVVPHKGQLQALRALRSVRDIYPDCLFVNIGSVRDQSYNHVLMSEIAAHNLNANCLFLPSNFSNEELAEFYNACDVYIQPSSEEGFGIAALEAMSCGKRIIATDTGEIATAIANSDGAILREADNIEELSQLIIDSYQQKSDIGAAFRLHDYIEKEFSWSTVAGKTMNLYHTLVESQRCS
ncbi:MAG: glycosyltransferase family 4 protein [Pyrinomonadaceae bacterium]